MPANIAAGFSFNVIMFVPTIKELPRVTPEDRIYVYRVNNNMVVLVEENPKEDAKIKPLDEATQGVVITPKEITCDEIKVLIENLRKS